jgi:hypothetical protein
MEQEVASELESLGFHVHTNRAFEDSDEGKSRELDVAAIREFYKTTDQQLQGIIELLCECKNSEQPFVFLLRPRTKADEHRKVEEMLLPRSEFHLPIEGRPNTMNVVPAIDHLGIRSLRYQSQQALKAVQFAKVVRDKSKWVANHAGLYDAIFYPLVKAMLARRAEITGRRSTSSYTWLFFPCVITTGDLYALDTTDPTGQPQHVDFISFTRHIKSDRIDGFFSVDFVKRTSLSNYVAKVIDPLATGIAALVEKDPAAFKRR